MQIVTDSTQLVRAFLEAEDIAANANHPLSSAHLLLALFTFPNRAQVLLSEQRIDEECILDAIRMLEDEPRRTVQRLRERAREIAQGSGSKSTDCLHLLIGITRLRDGFAYRLLERTGISLTGLRNKAVSFVTRERYPKRFDIPRASLSARPIITGRTQPPSTRVQEKVIESPVPSPAEPAGEQDEFSALEKAVEKVAQPKRPAPIAEVSTAGPEKAATLEEMAPCLYGCGVDLTERARSGMLDLVIGRDQELEALIDTLGKRRSNNPILIGPPGVGKTAIVEGLAVKIARGDLEVSHFQDKFLFALDTGSLVAGTSLRGAFSERMATIKEEVAKAGGKIIVFIDELHTLMGAGASGDGPQDAANELKTALARGEFPCIGATTTDEYEKHIEKDPALERRFTPIDVQEPSVDEAILILEGGITAYADHHQVDFALDAVHASVTLTHKFVNERKLPDKAFQVLDLAGSRARRRGDSHVQRIDIARVVHEWTQVPLERLAEADGDRFNRAEDIISADLIGHPHVVKAVCNSIRRGFAGFNSKRPIGSFLFLGPTGVGKTEMVKVLADFLFGRRDAVVRIDMSELGEQHSVARLIGAQPGYVGYEKGGQLTEALRKRPFQIVLFDEIEKAHPDVLNVLLQVLDEGHLTDSKGRRVSFSNTVIVLTSNLGAEAIKAASARAIGFGGNGSGSSKNIAGDVLENARAQLPPELWGRLDERLVFQPLTREEVHQIADLQLRESARTLFSEREVTLEWSGDVLDFLLDNGGFSPEQGARGMRQAIQQYVEGPVAEKILEGAISFGDTAQIDSFGENKLHIESIPSGDSTELVSPEVQ
ncbi:MAG: ATP-dependent Clp protease ATP-binding subunit [Deltaproteobacteria bacterium]|nr:ATP-dependent Clp protease ATP-binding subunit [Deltaproteobacteria bacterium]